VRVRQDGRVVSMTIVVAVGVREDFLRYVKTGRSDRGVGEGLRRISCKS
jgi:hypothetical protein